MSASKKAKGGKQKAGDKPEVRLQGHPRAKRQIGLAKSWAGLLALGFVAWRSYSSGVTFPDLALRSLLWGMAAYLLVWAIAVHVWRHIAIAEVRTAEQRWRERKAAEEEQIRKLTQALEDSKVAGGRAAGA